MQQLLTLDLQLWLTAVFQDGVLPSLMGGVFILLLLIIFTIFIFRTRDHNDYSG